MNPSPSLTFGLFSYLCSAALRIILTGGSQGSSKWNPPWTMVGSFYGQSPHFAPMASFAILDLYSIWWVVPLFVREIIVTFCRTGWLLEGKSIGAEKFGKLKFAFKSLPHALRSAILFFYPILHGRPLPFICRHG
jgi:hypothetical protein